MKNSITSIWLGLLAVFAPLMSSKSSPSIGTEFCPPPKEKKMPVPTRAGADDCDESEYYSWPDSAFYLLVFVSWPW